MKNYNKFLIVFGLLFFSANQASAAGVADHVKQDNCKSVKLNVKQLSFFNQLVQSCSSDEELLKALEELIDQKKDDTENGMFIFAMSTMGVLLCAGVTSFVIYRIVHECNKRRAVTALNAPDPEGPNPES